MFFALVHSIEAEFLSHVLESEKLCNFLVWALLIYRYLWYINSIRMFLVTELDVPVYLKNKLLIGEEESNH